MKADQGGEVFSPAREEEVLAQRPASANKGPLDEVTIRAIFRELISGSRALQKVQQGRVPRAGIQLQPPRRPRAVRPGGRVTSASATSPAVFEEVIRRHADYGVVPLENSTDGRIADTLDMFIRMPQMKICAEIRLRVHHHLLANCEQTEIRRVYSKAQALSQCRNWLRKNVPHATLHEVASTADAAELVPDASRTPRPSPAGRRPCGTACSILFAQHRGLAVQRDALRGHRPARHAAKTGNDKTALMFQIPPHARRRWPTCWTSSSRTRST